MSVSGIDRIPTSGAVLAFNHASYMDAVIVAAALPGEPTYVVKKELAHQIFAGLLLRRLGALFLDRFDVVGSLADLERATAAAWRKRMLVFFPEGTFTRRAGLSGFYLGAFSVAAQAKLPVVPGILRGTRSHAARRISGFRAGARSASASGIPFTPAGTDFASVVRLRDAARTAILSGCGEPDLGELIKPASPAAKTS